MNQVKILQENDAVIQDHFLVPDGQPTITIIEPGYPGCK